MKRHKEGGVLPDQAVSRVAKSWDLLGQEDPLWAILSDPLKRGGRWDLQEFLATGRREAEDLFAFLERLAHPLRWDSALDFGCGVGRVSRGLAGRFSHVEGIDVSQTMVERARRLHAGVANLRFKHSRSTALPYDSDSFDLVYSRLVLQHMATPAALVYVREFVRVLRVGGTAVFQAPSRCLVQAEVQATPVAFEAGTAFIEMHAHARAAIEEVIASSGGILTDVRDDPCAGDAFESLSYTVVKAPAKVR